MSEHGARRDPGHEVRTALRRTRQVRQFTDEPVGEEALREILGVARWTGSSTNWQPWRFLIVRDRARLGQLAELAPHAKHVAGAAVVIAIVMPGEKAEWEAYDEGRVAERILVAAQSLGLGAGIGWATPRNRDGVGELLGIERPAYVRTVISIGHPTRDATRPKSAPGTARRPLSELVVDEAG